LPRFGSTRLVSIFTGLQVQLWQLSPNYRVLQNTLPFRFHKFLCVTVWLWLSVTQRHAVEPSAMAPPVSLELRERIIAWKYELDMPISVIAQLANRCEKTVKNVLKTYRDYNQPINPFIRPRGRKRVLDHISSPSYSRNQLFFWMKSKTSFMRCGMSKSRSQHSLALSIASQSLIKLLPRRQWNGTSIFVLHGRLSWHNMMPVSLFSLTKPEWTIAQIFGQMVGLRLGKRVCAGRLFCEGRNTPFFPPLVSMEFWRWTSLRGL